MKCIFVDTAGWMAMADRNDRLHRDAVQVRDMWLEQGGLLVTTDYVADETLTLIRMRLGIQAAEKWWDQVSRSTRMQFEQINSDRFEKSIGWFFRWHDKSFSFTDCTSFVIMRELRLKQALTGDSHFVTAGFEIVP